MKKKSTVLENWTRHVLPVTLLAWCLAGGVGAARAQAPLPPLQVYAAGSLRGPLSEIASAYEAKTGSKLALTFGASGLLRERIEKGEPAEVFASADTQHPEKLASSGGSWLRPSLFVRNKLCALAAPAVKATPANLLEVMLDPAVKLGTSTPRADPSGDYTWELFRKTEQIRPGAYAALDAKALQLVGSTTAAQPPAGRLAYEWLMSEGRADLFLTYCTNAMAARKDAPHLGVVEVPAALQVAAAYGVTAKSDNAAATEFVRYVLSAPAQAVFSKFGFASP